MSRKYKFNDKDKLYFVSFAVIDWIPARPVRRGSFIRKEYKDVVVISLKYCIEKKNLELSRSLNGMTLCTMPMSQSCANMAFIRVPPFSLS